jgi:UDP-glucose 4-epimerase
VTGGAGYIGSHCILKLIELGYRNIVSIDNYSNSTELNLQQIENYTREKVRNEAIDLKDSRQLATFFEKHHDVTTLFHFAALKNPFESKTNPKAYYENNVGGLLNLLSSSNDSSLRNIIFSSTCAIYGSPSYIPVDEGHPINPLNPYAKSKWIGEEILKDVSSERNFKVASLRYFNPVGASHFAGLSEIIVEDSTNLFPQIVNVIKRTQKELKLFGTDLPTEDGSGVRDFIHVEDLISAHIATLDYLDSIETSNTFDIFNIGTGTGYSVLNVINAFEKISKKSINVFPMQKRDNEVSEIYSKADKILMHMSWKAKKTLSEMVEDTLKSYQILS